jgi:hypothetical protein
MAADNFTATLNLQYTPPGAPANSGVAALPVQGTYNAGQSGTIDVPTTAQVGDSFAVPFGSVQAAKLVVLKNNLSSEIAVKVNGASAVSFNIPPGGEFMFSIPTAPGANPFAALSFALTAAPTLVERISYFVFGD